MKFNKILSTALAFIMAFGFLTVIPHEVSAAVVTAQSAGKIDEEGNPVINYTLTEEGFNTREEKLATMDEVKTIGDITVYYEAYTGEVAFVNNKTDDVLFTNPYDVSSNYSKASAKVKEQLLSQVVITYLNNGKLETFYSFVEAAEREQITMKEIKNGIRVEYQIGEPAIQRLTPRMISAERMRKLIFEPIEQIIDEGNYNRREFDVEFWYEKFLSYYELKNPRKKGLSERAVKEMTKAFPICKQFPVYVCDTNISANELKNLEKLVKLCCPGYTYEELDFDNQQTGYVNTDQSPPRFTLALEYRVQADGSIDVTLPANGISFDETLYQLQDVTILPYMGTGSNEYNGYTFLPDGTGTIFRYEELMNYTYQVSGQMYGSDYAYHEVEGHNTQVFRYPVFGAVTNYSEARDPFLTKTDKLYSDAGFLAIITEGDSMATLTTDHGGPLHSYNSVYATFTPRPSDEYTLSETDSTKWTVTSSRRYTDSYTIKYIMLSDSEEDKYDPTYLGMAEAYRDYLTSAGKIDKISDSSDELPLYIESFGSIKGTDRVLSFPVTIDVPLTTFEDVQTMASELADLGIKNVNFKLTGFANGGLDPTMPYKLKWQEVLGGDDGINELIEYANKNGITLYPEFDMAYNHTSETFDGLSLKDHAVKTIDGRYTRKQVYDSGFQDFQPVGGAAISASVFNYFWDTFSGNYSKYNIGAISLSTLGTDLNSDFDEDDPHHREDSKEYTKDVLNSVSKDNSVMVSGGNAYTIEYADVITDVSLTSSEYLRASETVPFVGVVLHASKSFTGTPINMEGDISEAILNSIENGASIFFTLSYQNTQELKKDVYWSKYYSIAYDIWKTDVEKYYNVLNEALGDLQDQYITGHDFIDATRIPDADEKAEDDAVLAAAEAANAALAETVRAKYELAVKRAQRLGTEMPDEMTYEDMYYSGIVEPDVVSKYGTQKGSVVLVEYENGVQFVLNYNSFDVSVEVDGETHTVEATGFVRID